MKFLLCGKSWVACWSLQYLHDLLPALGRPIELVCATNKSDSGQDSWEPSFRGLAASLGVPTVETIAGAGLGTGDVLVSLEYDRIVKERALGGARAYNFHFSLLPAYRGCITSVWPIRNGETQSGVTLHVITPGIDDGPIVDQVAFPLPSDMTAYELYLRYCRESHALFRKNLVALLTGVHPRVEQDHAQATHYNRRSIIFSENRLAAFDQPATRVAGWVRSLVFPPYQLPIWDGARIEGAQVVTGLGPLLQAPGTILSRSERAAVVMCADMPIRLVFESAWTAARR